MQGIVVEIADHPKGYKRKVEILGRSIDFETERLELRTRCTFYENDNGDYGDPVSDPAPIVIDRALVAESRQNQFVSAAHGGAPVTRMSREIEVDIPENELVEGGPTTRMESEEYWILASTAEQEEPTEVPLENVMRLFYFLVHIEKNVPVVNGNMYRDYVLAEVAYGTYDKVGR